MLKSVYSITAATHWHVKSREIEYLFSRMVLFTYSLIPLSCTGSLTGQPVSQSSKRGWRWGLGWMDGAAQKAQKAQTRAFYIFELPEGGDAL